MIALILGYTQLQSGMPVGQIIRHSPLYLYLKLYTLSLTVSFVTGRPVSRHLGKIGTKRRGIEQTEQETEWSAQNRKRVQMFCDIDVGRVDEKQKAYAHNPVSLDNDAQYKQCMGDWSCSNHWECFKGTFGRWRRRLQDLHKVKADVERMFHDIRRYPELLTCASVR